jgi:hypothetical protein
VVGQTPLTLLQSETMVKFDHRAIDYSLYLVTGRELLPEGKVSRQCEYSENAASDWPDYRRIIMKAWKRCVFPVVDAVDPPFTRHNSFSR